MATFNKLSNKSGIKWQAEVRIKGHAQKKKSFSTKGQAQAWAAEYEAMIRAKQAGDPSLADKIMLEDALNKYATDCALAGKKASTLDLEARAGKHLLRIFRPDRALSHINGPTVSQYIKQRQREGYSASTIRQELAILSNMYNMARREWGFNVKNPVDDVKRPSPGKGRERILSPQEAEIVLELASRSRNKKFPIFVLLLMHTGMRSGEVARLHPKHIHLKKRYVRLVDTKTDTPRTVPLTKTATEALASMPAESSGYYFLKENHLKSKALTLKPGDIFRTCWRTLYRKLKEEHPSFSHFRPHDLRHTAASHLLMAGIDIRVVADILGHSTLAMVMRYTHLLDDYRQDVVDTIDFLGKAKN